jgi:hypothetical protein
MDSLFSLYWWDPQGNQHTELKHVDVNKIKSAWERLTCGPAAKMGVVQRVIITDALDCIAAEYKCPSYLQ